MLTKLDGQKLGSKVKIEGATGMQGADEKPVRVQAARSKRTLGEQRVSRAGKARG
jgi:hypothetical protein